MRISTSALFDQNLAAMQREMQSVSSAQLQLSSGQKWQTAGADPTAYTQAQSFDQVVAQNARYTSAANSAQTQLQLSDSTLSSGVDVLQQVQQLVIQANSAAQSDTSRAAIAKQLSSLRDQLMSIANTGDGQGRYLFGGAANATAPFTWNGSSADYHGDATVSTAQIGSQRTIARNDTGSDLFMGIPVGNGTFSVSAASGNTGGAAITASSVTDASAWDGGSYTVQFTSASQYQIVDSSSNVVQSGSYSDGGAISFKGVSLTMSGTPASGDSFSVAPAGQQDTFAIIDQLAKLVAQPQGNAAQRAQVQTALQQGLSSLQSAQNRVIDARSSIGTRMNAVTDALSVASSLTTAATASASDLRDADYTQAVTTLQRHMTSLQAAQQSYSLVNGLSLFKYLG